MDKILRVLKRTIHRILFIYIYFGKKIKLNGTPKYINCKNVLFGENISINENVFFHASKEIIIGNNVTFSYGSQIITETYNTTDYDKYKKREHDGKKIVIGNNVWIGASAMVLPGVTIADNIIIGAGSVVTHDLNEQYTIYAGNPARKIKKFGNSDNERM